MFWGASAFNQCLTGEWIESSAPSANTFYGSSGKIASIPTNTKALLNDAIDEWIADQPTAEANYCHISTWNTSKVTDMNSLFMNRNTFNADISGWDTAKVTNMSELFYNADAFNIDISDWNVGQVTTME